VKPEHRLHSIHDKAVILARTIPSKRSFPQGCTEKRWGRGSLACRLTRGHQEVQQPPSLLAAGCYHCQKPLGKPTTSFTVRSETALAPRHRRSQRARRPIIGRLHAFRANVHGAGQHFVNSRHNPAILRSGLSWPRRNCHPSRAWSGTSRRRNSGRSHSPARKRYHKANSRSISASPLRSIGTASPPRSISPWKSRLR